MSSSPDPNNPAVYDAELASPHRPKGSQRRPLLIVTFILGLMSVPMISTWLPGEAARWRIAAAEEQKLNGDLEGALRSLDAAILEYEDSPELYWRRALFFAEAKQYEKAVEDLDRARLAGYPEVRVLQQRSTMLHHLGRHDEAISHCKELLQLGENDISIRITALNQLAYAQALGGVELKDALAHVEEAIRLEGENAAMLDTRGFLHYLLGNYEAAIKDMNSAVATVEATYSMTDPTDLIPDQRLFASYRPRMNETIAVLRYHRALVYDKLLERAKADADRKRVRELGFEPNPSLF